MKIRSITCFLDPNFPLNESKITAAGAAIRQAVESHQSAGYEVQTTRLATIPFPRLFSGLSANQVVAAAKQIEQTVVDAGFDYVAIGPALIGQPDSYTLIPEIISETEIIFCSAEMATRQHGVSLAAVKACANVITQLAPQDENGFANLYFTALANVGPESPFFPAAYHAGGQPTYALAVEAASLAVEAFEQAESLQDGLNQLKGLVEQHAQRLAAVGEEVHKKSGLPFNGIDFSLAPFPSPDKSLGSAIEHIGVPKIGQHGSLAAAAMLASTLDQADFPRIGFSGLLFPQLEDSALALRAAEGVLTVKDLLMYSAVCGTGLDTIPLPGDTSAEEIAPLLLDIAALSLRLDKPLTARLMPIPDKQAGEPTSFNFDYFANSKVMPLASSEMKAFLDSDDHIPIKPRKSA
jgi:uncharacterized protein (UPF0210 family)